MSRKYLEDKDSGALFHLDRIAAIAPAPIKGDRTDQHKVTHVNTIIHTAGGSVLHTTIPFDLARKETIAVWAPAAPPADPPAGE